MAITAAFRDAVAGSDISGVRTMMATSLLSDPTFSEFREMEQLASGLSGLYEPHDGRSFREEEAWDKDYLDLVEAQILGNFSRERMEHLKRVVRKIYPLARFQPAHTASHSDSRRSSVRPTEDSYRRGKSGGQSTYQRQKAEDRANGRIVKVVGTTTAVGAVVGGSGAALAGAAAGWIVVGAATGAAVGYGCGKALARGM